MQKNSEQYSNAERLKIYFEEKISAGEYPSGMKLPSIRETMKRFNVSQGTVRIVMNYLEKSGMIMVVHGSGTFVRTRLKGNSRRLMKLSVFFAFDSIYPGIYSTVLLGIQKAAEEASVSCQLNFGWNEYNSRQIMEMLEGSSGAILLGAEESGYSYREFPLKLPVTGVCMNDSLSGRISIIDIDPFVAAESACSYFSNKGIRDVNIITHSARAYKTRGIIFSIIWNDNGGTCKTVEFSHDIMPEPDKAYLFTSGGVMECCCRMFQDKRGRALPEESTILGLDGRCKYDPESIQGPVVLIDWQFAGRMAFNECIYRINNPGSPPKRIYLPGKLVI